MTRLARRRTQALHELPDVPPAVPLLLDALARSHDWDSTRRNIRGMLPDLRKQSEAFAVDGVKAKLALPSSRPFQIHASGLLDIFDSRCVCPELRCRVQAAQRLSRSLGLIGDHVWLTDFVSDQYLEDGRFSNARLDRAVADALVLAQLVPLIAAGVVKFRSPMISSCNHCMDVFRNEVERITDAVFETFAPELKIAEKSATHALVDMGRCYEAPMYTVRRKKPRERFGSWNRFKRDLLREQVRSVLWTSREAAMTRGALFTNSRVGLAGMLQAEGRFGGLAGMRVLDQRRSFELPWVSELTAAQIVQLREEAANALPRFRERMAKVLVTAEDDAGSISKHLHELREEAEEVRAELNTTRKKSARFWKTTYALLGLGISAYGVASDQPVAGVAGLLPIIHLMINHVSGQEKEVQRLTCRPGYVLVRAQEIAAHAHDA
jgi:hypothetical protein